MNLVDTNNCIPTNLRADIMRCSMENKNLLNKKGSIYVGTGETITVGGQKIYTTKALELGNTGEILQNINGELGYSQLKQGSFNASVNYANQLKKTFQSFSVKQQQLSGTIPSLVINKDNFSSSVVYSNLIRVENNKSEITMLGDSKVSLEKNEKGLLKLVCSKQCEAIYKHFITITGLTNTELGVSNLTVVFAYIGPHPENTSVYSYLRDYVNSVSELSSEVTSSWSGWVYPSFWRDGKFTLGSYEQKMCLLSSWPLYLVVECDRETHSTKFSMELHCDFIDYSFGVIDEDNISVKSQQYF